MALRRLFMKKTFALYGILAMLLTLTPGCGTGRNYQSDIDSLNSRVASLQSQLAAKDEEISSLKNREGDLSAKDLEISRLQNDLRDQQAAAARLENDKRMLTDKLNGALATARQKAKQDNLSDIK